MRQLHLWLGLTLGALGIFIGASGSILVYDHAIDGWLNPQRYAVSGAGIALTYAEYVARASDALPAGGRVINLRLPEEPGMPIVMTARAQEGSGFQRLFIDPPTGKVLDTAAGGGFIGWVHRFHENLTLRAYWGREMVGLVGIAMLVSALTGLYLWWPGRTRFRRALKARPGLALSRNLHYLAGFYGSIVLALLSFTGIWLAYAQYVQPNRAVPVQGSAGQATLPIRVILRDERGPVSVFLDPATGAVLRRTEPTAVDRFLSMQRVLHTGAAFGPLGRVVLCAAGLLPLLLVTTGTLMWLRHRAPFERT
jgi:uncharacterized iron-regulated membrane protein